MRGNTIWHMKWSESCSVMSDSLQPHGLYSNSICNSPDQNTGVSSLSLLQGIFPTQGWNPGLPHCRWILYQLSHKRSPKILEYVSLSLLQQSSQPRNRTRVSCIAGWFFTDWAIRETLAHNTLIFNIAKHYRRNLHVWILKESGTHR